MSRRTPRSQSPPELTHAPEVLRSLAAIEHAAYGLRGTSQGIVAPEVPQAQRGATDQRIARGARLPGKRRHAGFVV